MGGRGEGRKEGRDAAEEGRKEGRAAATGKEGRKAGRTAKLPTCEATNLERLSGCLGKGRCCRIGVGTRAGRAKEGRKEAPQRRERKEGRKEGPQSYQLVKLPTWDV